MLYQPEVKLFRPFWPHHRAFIVEVTLSFLSKCYTLAQLPKKAQVPTKDTFMHMHMRIVEQEIPCATAAEGCPSYTTRIPRMGCRCTVAAGDAQDHQVCSTWALLKPEDAPKITSSYAFHEVLAQARISGAGGPSFKLGDHVPWTQRTLPQRPIPASLLATLSILATIRRFPVNAPKIHT